MSVLSSNYYMVLYPNTFAASWTDHVAGRINNDVRPWAMVIGLATAALSGGKTTRQCLHMLLRTCACMNCDQIRTGNPRDVTIHSGRRGIPLKNSLYFIYMVTDSLNELVSFILFLF